MAETATRVPPTKRVQGVTYRTPAEAFAGADAIEHEAQERADAYRDNGDEGVADTTIDRGRERAEDLRAWARAREEADAAATEQPADVPVRAHTRGRGPTSSRRRSSSASSRGGGHPIEAEGDRVHRELVAPAAGDVGDFLDATGLDDYTEGTAELGWSLAGMAVGLSIVYLLLTGHGPRAVEGIVGGFAGFSRRLFDVHDPLVLGDDGQRVTAPEYGPSPTLPTRAGSPGPTTAGPHNAGDGRVLPGYRDPRGNAVDTTVHGSAGTLVELRSLARIFGLSITSTTGGEHVAGSYHYRHRAIDVKPGAAFGRFAAWARQRPALFRELYGPMDWHIEDGRVVDGAYPDHQDHGHIAI